MYCLVRMAVAYIVGVMHKKNMTFGKVISEARKSKGLKLRDCAALILKEDGVPISFQYLYDIELDRRNAPSQHLLEQFSRLLNIPIEILYFYAEVFPPNVNPNLEPDKIISAYKSFADALK